MYILYTFQVFFQPKVNKENVYKIEYLKNIEYVFISVQNYLALLYVILYISSFLFHFITKN